METASVIIPSIGRAESLKKCLESLKEQSFKDFKTYVINDVAPLYACRNKGAKQAKGKFLVFIDDDTYCSRDWLKELVESFGINPLIAGVSGPAIIPEIYKQNRDLFRHKFIKKFVYDKFFCDGKEALPGHLMPSGAFTTGSSNLDCNYFGEVHFLEACNMAFRRDIFEKVGGFSSEYGGVGEWQEPDICFRMRQLGYKMLFNPRATMYHRPSRSGIYRKRFEEAKLRYQNYLIFSKKWITPHWKHTLFKLFMKSYYALTTA